MSRNRMCRSTTCALVLLTSVLFAFACSDGSATDACDQVVDAFARAWSRCGRGTYEELKANFATAFNCPATKNFDQDKVNQCVSTLNALDCSAVMSGTSPGACDTGALTR